MRIKVIAAGQKMPAWVQAGVDEYKKRMPREWQFQFIELPLGPRSKSQSIAKAIAAEDQSMLNALDEKAWVVALDVQGKNWSTEQLASHMLDWQMQGQDIQLLIGGPDGLGAQSLSRANQRWSLSGLTLPHPLVRVLLAEQLYRSWTVINNHPYHK